jgi:small subunit ribosomal protein S6
MKHRYESLLVLDTQGKEDTVKETIERLEKDFAKEGAAIESVQKMEKREFTYAAGHLSSGYFVNFVFEAEPTVLEKLRAKFKLDPEIYRQHYQKLTAKKVAK